MNMYTILENLTKTIIRQDSDRIHLQLVKGLNQKRKKVCWSPNLKSLTDTILFLSWQKNREEPLLEIEC